MGTTKTQGWTLQVGTLTLAPKGFNATTNFLAVYYDGFEVQAGTYMKDLYSKPVPKLGFEIKGLFKIGLILTYRVGWRTNVWPGTTVAIGASASFPDDALITIDLVNQNQSLVSGLENLTMVPFLDITALSASARFSVASELVLAFGFDIEKMQKMDVELNLKIPQLAMILNAGYGKMGPRRFTRTCANRPDVPSGERLLYPRDRGLADGGKRDFGADYRALDRLLQDAEYQGKTR